MPRVLIVTSMFLPHLAADVHRPRMLASELPHHGWEVELLVPGADFHSADLLEPDQHLLDVVAPVHRAAPRWAGLFRLLRSNSLSWRAYRPMRMLGDSLLAARRFDLVYVSCSQANFFYLGAAWRKRFGIPFIVDLHDPWYSPLPQQAGHHSRWKRRLANEIARLMERATLREAAGLVSVSALYFEAVNRRYAGQTWESLQPLRQATIPFGASEGDYRAVRQVSSPRQGHEAPGIRTVVYTGAGGAIMADSFRALCRYLIQIREQSPALLSGIRFRLFGTEPAAAGREPVLSRIATEEGVSDLFSESPSRLSYLEALRWVDGADGLLVLGVDDAAYSPSKLFLYALSGKPLIACMKSGSTVGSYFASLPELGELVEFGFGAESSNGEALRRVAGFLEDVGHRRTTDRGATLKSFLAPEMSRRHVELFDRCIQAKPGTKAARKTR